MKFVQKIRYFFFLFILASSFVNSQNIPSPRCLQASSLIGTKLYFFSGDLSTSDTFDANAAYITNEVWYLDLSSSFNTISPPWNKDVEMPIGFIYGGSCVSPIDNSVYLIGGSMYIPNTANISLNASSAYVFKSSLSQWTTPNITSFNSSFTKREEIQPVIDTKGKIFIFAGTNYENRISAIYNDMNIFDTTTMTWSTLDVLQNTPNPRAEYTATLLPNGIIVYIGGNEYTTSSVPASMNEIQTFDTNNYNWTYQLAGGASVGSRIGHSAVLKKNGNIIIYGGLLENNTGPQAVPYIAELDTSTWIWSIPNVNQTNAPPALSYHSAAIYGDYMIIAFGQGPVTSLSYANVPLMNNVYILDTINYIWVTTMDNGSSKTPSINNPKTNSSHALMMIGIGIGLLVIGIASFVGLCIYLRWVKQPKVAPTNSSGSAVGQIKKV